MKKILVLICVLFLSGCVIDGASSRDSEKEELEARIKGLEQVVNELEQSSEEMKHPVAQPEQPAKVIIQPVVKSQVPVPEVLVEEVEEDPVIAIEKCKVNSNKIAEDYARKAKENYVYQKTVSGVCNFKEPPASIEYRSQLNTLISEAQIRLAAAEESGSQNDVRVAKTNLLNYQTMLLQLENDISSYETTCVNKTLIDAGNLYDEKYSQKYSMAYQKCINDQ